MADADARLDRGCVPYRAVLALAGPRPSAAYRDLVRARHRRHRSLVGLTEFAEVWVIFHNVDVLGGLDFHAVLLVFGLSNLAFSLADMVVGHLDHAADATSAPGTLDAFYLRPLPLLAQLMTSDLSLRRLGRARRSALVALVVGAAARRHRLVGGARSLLIVLAVVSGTAIFAALFSAAGGLQFFLVDGAEFTNAFTYGGSYAAQRRQQVFPDPLRLSSDVRRPDRLRRLPAGRWRSSTCPGRRSLPAWLAWCTPLAALLAWAVAAAAAGGRAPGTTKEPADEHEPIIDADLTREFIVRARASDRRRARPRRRRRG